MVMPIKQMSYVEAMKDYFGFLPGQNMTAFFAELKALSAEDREWFKAELLSVGYQVIAKV